jgi:transglutaminase-like putative cysteine protease
MQYKITHTTTYEYAETVPLCQNKVHLTPRADGGQSCAYHRLNIKPAPATCRKWVDYFGNSVMFFAITRAHKRLNVSATSAVRVTREAPADLSSSLPWDSIRDALPADRSQAGLEAYQFRFDSPHVPRLPELADYAAESFAPGRPILEAIGNLTARINTQFTYDPKATSVSTPVHEVLQLRRGVCQDLAHLQIGCLRSLGLAARYVSGYLRTIPPEGKPRLVGADASHAWPSVFCGPRGWVDVDPTNNVFPSVEHITVSWGRDYGDVCPIQWMFVGGGQHKMRVAVDVVPIT